PQGHPPEPADGHHQRGVDAEGPHRPAGRADDGHDEQQGGQDLDVRGEPVDGAGPRDLEGPQPPGAHGAPVAPRPRRRTSRKTTAPTARVTSTPATPARPPDSRSSSTPSTP